MTDEAIIRIDEKRENIGVTTPYSEPFMDMLKAASPWEERGKGRGWDADLKIWVLPLEHLNEVEAVVSRFFKDYRLEYEEVPFLKEFPEPYEEEETE